MFSMHLCKQFSKSNNVLDTLYSILYNLYSILSTPYSILNTR